MMSDEEFDKLGRRYRMTPEQEQRWREELQERCKLERLEWKDEKANRKGFSLKETNSEPREPRRYSVRISTTTKHLHD
jgi:hypothetical protein